MRVAIPSCRRLSSRERKNEFVSCPRQPTKLLKTTGWTALQISRTPTRESEVASSRPEYEGKKCISCKWNLDRKNLAPYHALSCRKPGRIWSDTISVKKTQQRQFSHLVLDLDTKFLW